MKKLLLIFAIALSPAIGHGQITINNISFAATNLVPLNYVYSEIDELVEGKTLTNAIRLDLCINSRGCNVYAKVVYPGAPGVAPENWMNKTLINDNSPNVQVPNLTTSLNNANTLLFMQPSDGINTTKNYSYYYNLNLRPVTTFVTNGMYNFNILYTMTLL